MLDCYISSTSTTHINRANEIIGPCGPCSWINLLELKGSFELEKELADIGRLKPFYASAFISFLLWAQKYSVNLIVYASSFEISDGAFEMMFNYENIPESRRSLMRDDTNNFVKTIVSQNKNNLYLLKGHPINLIDKFIDNGFRVAFNVACKFPSQDDFIGHMRVCVKKKNDCYTLLDSYFGKLNYTREEMIQDIDNVTMIGGTHELAAYKKPL